MSDPKRNSKPRSVVITGLGVVVRDAIGISEFSEWLATGGGIPDCPTQFDASRFRASKAYEINPERVCMSLNQAFERYGITSLSSSDIDCARYGLLAGIEALGQAGIFTKPEILVGCALATTSGGLMDRFYDALLDNKPTIDFLEQARPASTARIISETLGLVGPFSNFSCACVSSLGALSYAYMRVRNADAPVMLVGGSDRMREADFAGFNALRAMDRESCKPFDTNRRGMIIGDGAAMMVLEDEEHALARGAKPLVRLMDVALASDSHHITSPQPEGLTRAMLQALRHANVAPEAIGYVNCHGTGTPLNDAVETQALENVFGHVSPKPMISSTKGVTGHLLGSSGAIEAVITALSLARQNVPAMTTTEVPEDISFTLPIEEGPHPISTEYAMKNSLGFGGLNGSLIMQTMQPGDQSTCI